MNDKNLHERSELVGQLILLTEDLYHRGGLSKGQLGLLSTIIGAAIWYLPGDNKLLFSKKISRGLLEALENGEKEIKMTEEHYYPRKVSATKLYEVHLDDLKKNPTETLKDLYLNEFGLFNLVLKQENDRLKKFQKVDVFVSPEMAYQQCGIELIDLTPELVNRFPKFKKYI
jgi:hypothetical protein